jgi:EAL domain-containing protein (putative c-di-GMP-specific phosphodiesterase class I)
MHSPNSPLDLAARHRLRVRWILWLGAGVMSALGLAWSIYFGAKGAWGVASGITVFTFMGVAVGVLTRQRRTRLASYLFISGSFLIVCAVAWVLDVPSVQEPRTFHLYLLFLALSSSLFLRDEALTVRILVASTCLAAFVGFAGTNAGLDSAYALPDNVREVGTWLNTILSIAAMYALIHVMVSDRAETSALELELRLGIANGEFFLLYQPQVDAQGQVLGAEVLLRWSQPQRGMVSPVEFIALAERTGLILALGQWALEAACVQLVAWAQEPSKAHLVLAVNVSAHQLQQADFVEQVQAIVARTGVRAQSLKLELTESILLHDLDDIIQKMTALKAMGLRFSLDDFGTGYSSLSYLKHLPLDQLKIDQAFVRDVLSNSQDAAIAKTIINLAKGLNFSVIAEGVETPAQRAFLLENDCHTFQGELFSRPVTVDEFEQFVGVILGPNC